MNMLQREAAVVSFVGAFHLYGMLGKSALEIVSIQFTVDPELVLGVSPSVCDLAYL